MFVSANQSSAKVCLNWQQFCKRNNVQDGVSHISDNTEYLIKMYWENWHK